VIALVDRVHLLARMGKGWSNSGLGMPKLLATDGEGERLDRFELVAELASGGMATVYLARLSGVAGFQRLVAIKRLHPHLAKEPDFIEMFLDEARLAARIHHPNVVPIQEVGESERGYYLVMDYVAGDTLARLLARAAQTNVQIPWGVTIRILLDTLAGLHAAHELSDDLGQPLAIVHRDVSPQNILVGADGIARITDFGVARAASRLSTTRSGQLKGKLAYMAPEHARGEKIDRRADVFSCGIVLWEALALKRLFKGDGEAATLNRVLYDPIAPPSTHRADVPPLLEAICMKALERDVDQRFATAEEFADELERVGRSVSCVGSVRDVATCLEQVFGADLSQQREAVRAWLARSEPSASPRPRPSFPESVQTRVEGARSEPSGARTRPSRATTSAARIDRQAVTAPAPADSGATSVPPEKVSSVSSAVLHVNDASEPAAGHGRRGAPGRAIAIATVVAVVLGAGAWGAARLAAPSTAATVPPAEKHATVPSAVVSAPPPSRAPSSSVSATVPVGSATPSAVTTSPPATRPGIKRSPVVSPKPHATPPAATATTTALPDDLSKNPYR